MTPKEVSRFEANLLRILWFLLRRLPAEQAWPLIVDRCEPPRCLSRAAVGLIQDALAKGCMLLLAREGGWRRERHLRNERAVEGRLWERTAPHDLGLSFSGQTLRFLMWITANKPGDGQARWSPPASELTLGDQVFLFFAYAMLRESEVGKAVRQLAPFAGNLLCRLGFPEDFAGLSNIGVPDSPGWLSGVGPAILEALQRIFAKGWLECEMAKGSIVQPERMRQLGAEQLAIMENFLQAINAAGRRDLARFVLFAASELLRGQPVAKSWIGSLDVKGLRLADRVATYRAATACLRQLDRLQQWDRQARTIGYLDESYTAAQLWKADWEAADGETLAEKARAVIKELEPLPT
jgi:hypothetical protein